MRKANIDKLESFAIVTIVSLAILGFFILGFVPALSTILDTRSYEDDQRHASNLNRQLYDLPISETSFNSGSAVREALRNHNTSKTVHFDTRSRNSALFYDRITQEIIVLRFDEALEHAGIESISTISDTQKPDQPFGESLLLLSEAGSPLADAVSHIERYASGGIAWQSEPRLIQRIHQTIERHLSDKIVVSAHHSVTYDLAETWLLHHHPDTTLYVNNHTWRTNAKTGDAIQNIVFAPGISTIPRFNIATLTRHALTFDHVILPDTVRTIESGAFGTVFNIQTLSYNGTNAIKVGLNALNGVHHVDLDAILYDRDDPSFAITDFFEDRQLILYDPEVLAQSLALDLSHARRFFTEQGLTVLSFNIELNLNALHDSRVYVFTEEGYHGYIVPVPKSP